MKKSSSCPVQSLNKLGLSHMQLLRSIRQSKLYKRRGVNALRQNFLSKVAKESTLNKKIHDFKLFKLLNKYANILELNEVQVAVWALLLDQAVDQFLSIPKLLLYTGFTAKKYFEKDCRVLEAKLKHLVQGFAFKYNNWLLMTNATEDLSLQAVNAKLTELSKASVKPRPREGYYEDLVSSIMPENEQKFTEESEASTVCDMDNQLEYFETTTMGGEKLSPIYTQIIE